MQVLTKANRQIIRDVLVDIWPYGLASHRWTPKLYQRVLGAVLRVFAFHPSRRFMDVIQKPSVFAAAAGASTSRVSDNGAAGPESPNTRFISDRGSRPPYRSSSKRCE